MTKRYIRKSEIADQDQESILLNNGELLDIDHCQLLVPVINRRSYCNGTSLQYHLNGSIAAPARPYGYRPFCA